MKLLDARSRAVLVRTLGVTFVVEAATIIARFAAGVSATQFNATAPPQFTTCFGAFRGAVSWILPMFARRHSRHCQSRPA